MPGGPVLGGVLAAVLAAPAAELQPWPCGASQELCRVATALRASRAADAPPPKVLAERIARSGPGAAEALLEVLLRRRVPESKPEDAPQILSVPQRAIVLAALPDVGADSFRGALERRRGLEADAVLAFVELQALSAIGTRSDLVRLAGLGRAAAGDPDVTAREAREAQRAAISAILRTDPQAWNDLEWLLRRFGDSFGREVLLAAASSRDPRALPVLAVAAELHPTLTPLAASLVGKCGHSLDPAVDRQFCDLLVLRLEGARPDDTRTYLDALGRLDEGEHTALLVELLSADEPATRAAAHAALKHLTGLTFSADPGPWAAWLAREEDWHSTRQEAVVLELSASSRSAVVAALSEIAGRTLHRSELANEVAVVLQQDDPALRTLACEVLQRLGSAQAMDALLETLADPRAEVASAAHKALEAISGLRVPVERDAARGLLRPS